MRGRGDVSKHYRGLQLFMYLYPSFSKRDLEKQRCKVSLTNPRKLNFQNETCPVRVHSHVRIEK